MVKNGHDLLGRETLKSAYLMNELINWAVFFHTDTNWGKLKVTLIAFGWSRSKVSGKKECGFLVMEL